MVKFCGDRLRQAREIRGLSRSALASACGCSRQNLMEFETDQRQPNNAILERIALCLSFPMRFFRLPPGPDFPLGSLLLYKQ